LVPLPVVPEVPDVPLDGGVVGVALGSVGVAGAGVVVSGAGVGVGVAAGGVVAAGVAGAVVSVAPVLVPVSAARSLQPARVAVASTALNSSVVLSAFMIFPFTVSKSTCLWKCSPE
jgi:hypothetical protein